MIITELAFNAIRRRGGRGRLHFTITPHAMICRVIDDGPGLLLERPHLTATAGL